MAENTGLQAVKIQNHYLKTYSIVLGHLIRKEMLELVLSLRFLILWALGMFMIWISLCSGYIYYQARLRDYQVAQITTEERIQQMMVADDISEINVEGYFVHKPPAPMSIFVRGLEPVLGRSGTTGFSDRTPRLK